jgi:preprotein translocase subunit SecA
MDYLREAIRFHGYAQKDPLMIYKKEGFELFQKCLESIATFTSMRLLNIRIEMGAPAAPQMPLPPKPQNLVENTAEIKANTEAAPAAEAKQAARTGVRKPKVNKVPVRSGPKPGRNDICWCGSGKKYKKCHGEGEE